MLPATIVSESHFLASELQATQVKIEILYVADCPTHPSGVALVNNVVPNQGILAEILEILIPNEGVAKELQFRGSPTVRVNGKDVIEECDGSEGNPLCCRVYSGSNQIGLPPIDVIRRAIVDAK